MINSGHGRYIFMKKAFAEQKFLSPFSLEYWKAAASEVTNVRTLAICAVLIAMRVALKNVYIPLAQSLNVYVGFLVNAVSGAICGPILSLIGGAVSDILGFYLSSQSAMGPMNPLFTLIEMLGSFIFAMCLYKRKITPKKIFLGKFLINVICNILLTTLALKPTFENGIIAVFLTRIAKNIFFLPLEVILLVLLFNAVTPMLVRMGLVPKPQEKMKINVVKCVIIIAVLVIVTVLVLIFRERFSTLFYDLYQAFKIFVQSALTAVKVFFKG